MDVSSIAPTGNSGATVRANREQECRGNEREQHLIRLAS
jgi:hypothetical protein